MMQQEFNYSFNSCKQWGITLAISLLIHCGIIYYVVRTPLENHSPLLMSAVMLEFSDPPQSISIIEQVPIGPVQQMVKKTQLPEHQENQSLQDNLPSVEDHSPPEVKPEIVVKKQENQEIVKKVKPKKNVSHNKEQLIKKQRENKVKQAVIDKVESPYSNHLTTAPVDGNSQKIAAEFTSSSQGNSKQVTWNALVRSHLERYLRYPQQALNKKWRGRTMVRITIDPSGKVLAVSLHQSSGRAEFDHEAIANVKRASPLPKPPAHLISGQTLQFIVPINFDFDKYS
ncbi:protein TonB [Volucribacter psittacicida]|uniref:Protein TonB n=1 Tax=Volucribacter psittacicida TaxID=203482 RepID=A0A4R1G0V2_9PAST|nr:energy transducer TonB [Volucribacter psittacicida]TCK01687.1 protein TonB [Volucribacter psittacicida]